MVQSTLYDPVVLLVTVLLEKFFHHLGPRMSTATVLVSSNSPDPYGHENGLKNIYSLFKNRPWLPTGRGVGEGWTGSVGLIGANYCL